LFSIVFLPPFSVVKTFFVIPVARVEECLLWFERLENFQFSRRSRTPVLDESRQPAFRPARANLTWLALWYGWTKNGGHEREVRAEGELEKKMHNEMRSGSTKSFSASIGVHEG